MGRDYVSELLPLTDTLFISQMIYEYGERRWNDTDRKKTEELRKNLSQYHFVHHKSHVDCLLPESDAINMTCFLIHFREVPGSCFISEYGYTD
jgi:hypothetical protein